MRKNTAAKDKFFMCEDVYHGKRGKVLVGEVIDEIFPTGLSNHLTTAWEATEI